jgi:hypothetical protein
MALRASGLPLCTGSHLLCYTALQKLSLARLLSCFSLLPEQPSDAVLSSNVVQCTGYQAGYVRVLPAAACLMLPRLLLQQLLHSPAVGSDQLPSDLAVVMARLQE